MRRAHFLCFPRVEVGTARPRTPVNNWSHRQRTPWACPALYCQFFPRTCVVFRNHFSHFSQFLPQIPWTLLLPESHSSVEFLSLQTCGTNGNNLSRLLLSWMALLCGYNHPFISPVIKLYIVKSHGWKSSEFGSGEHIVGHASFNRIWVFLEGAGGTSSYNISPSLIRIGGRRAKYAEPVM